MVVATEICAGRDSLPMCRGHIVRCAAVETGGKRMSTGHSHFILRVPPTKQKSRYPYGYLVFCNTDLICVHIRTGCVPKPKDSPTD